MLKSTHRQAPEPTTSVALPTGWTEHKAPSGHIYYYHAETKKSTYTRPVEEPAELQIDYNATQPDYEVQASMKVMDDFRRQNPQAQPEPIHFNGGRGYQDRSRRDRFSDRPKSKKVIKGCDPWVLVTTKYKRRFVHNLETKESLWKFPSDVMMAVIEMEKEEWQSRQKVSTESVERQTTSHASGPENREVSEQPPQNPDDSDSYEEVEVTDDEDGDQSTKRPRIEDDVPNVNQGPVEFDEDDIEWQLAQMEEDGLNNDEFDHQDYGNEEDEDEGLPLTLEDSHALFRTLLDEVGINPYSPFDNLLEENNIQMVEDQRWTALPNMGARRNAFKDWSRDRVNELKIREAEAAATSRKTDPRIQYLEFLCRHATPKLYWPEFKRKFKKEPEIKGYELTDKEREKIYREYATKLKKSEPDRKKEFISFIKALPESTNWNRATKVSHLPETILKDTRFYLIRDQQSRDDLVAAHLATLKS